MQEHSGIEIKNLYQIASYCLQKNKHVIGSVVCIMTDASAPIYRPQKQDYIIKISCVDQFVNVANSFGAMCRFLSLFIVAGSQKQLHDIFRVGDVIFINNAIFNLWSGMTLECKYTSTMQKIAFLDWQTLTPFKLLNFRGHDQKLKDKNLVARVQYLRDWFIQNINEFYRPKVGLIPHTKYGINQEAFNMILKVYDHSEDRVFEKHGQNVLVLNDRQGYNYFWLKLKPINVESYEREEEYSQQEQVSQVVKVEEQEEDSSNRQVSRGAVNSQARLRRIKKKRLVRVQKQSYPKFQQDTVILIKRIRYISKSQEINFDEGSNLLILPKCFNCKQKMNYLGFYSTNEKKKLLMSSKQVQHNSLTYFTEKQHSLGVTFLRALSQKQNQYSSGKKRQQFQIDPKFIVSCAVLYWKGQLKLYHYEYQMFLHEDYLYQLSYTEKKETLKNQKMGYVFEGVLGVIDRSSQCMGTKIFEISLFSYDSKGLFYDSRLQKQVNQKIGSNQQSIYKSKLMKHITKLLNQAKKQSSYKKPIRLMIQSVKSKKLLFRLVNTVIGENNQ